MTRFVRWLRKLRDKWFGRWDEGPAPPMRLTETVVMFTNLHPTASRAEWTRFAIEFARECYRSGYIRGYEHVERDPEFVEKLKAANPDALANALDPDWRFSPPVQLEEDPFAIPPMDEAASERERVEKLLQKAKEEGP